MEYIQLNKANILSEHICCALSNREEKEIASKKSWLFKEFDDGLVFLKRDARGKCFIEYLPAENAWAPILADGYMYINCLWVSGSLKGHGYSTDLLDMCIADSKNKGRKGLCILSSAKKRHYLADPEYLKYKGFKVADTSECGVQLWYLPIRNNAPVPKFTHIARHPYINQYGYVLYYSDQCPFTGKYVDGIVKAAKDRDIQLKVVHITDKDMAQKAPTPTTSFTLFIDGKYVTNELLNEQKFKKIM